MPRLRDLAHVTLSGLDKNVTENDLSYKARLLWAAAHRRAQGAHSDPYEHKQRAGRVASMSMRHVAQDVWPELAMLDEDKQQSFTKPLYAALRASGNAVCLQPGEHPPVWFVADEFTDANIVRVYLPSPSMSAQERRITPDEAGETREPAPVTVTHVEPRRDEGKNEMTAQPVLQVVSDDVELKAHGTITQRGSGVWRVRMSLGWDSVTGKYLRKTQDCQTYEEAEQVLADWRQRKAELRREQLEKARENSKLALAGRGTPGRKSNESLACPECGLVMSRKDNLNRHRKLQHGASEPLPRKQRTQRRSIGGDYTTMIALLMQQPGMWLQRAQIEALASDMGYALAHNATEILTQLCELDAVEHNDASKRLRYRLKKNYVPSVGEQHKADEYHALLVGEDEIAQPEPVSQEVDWDEVEQELSQDGEYYTREELEALSDNELLAVVAEMDREAVIDMLMNEGGDALDALDDERAEVARLAEKNDVLAQEVTRLQQKMTALRKALVAMSE